jgi:hypothetical protein
MRLRATSCCEDRPARDLAGSGCRHRPARGEARPARSVRTSVWFAIGLAAMGLGLAGCQAGKSTPGLGVPRASFFLEAPDGQGTPIVLPKSGVWIDVNRQPVFTPSDIINIEIAQVELGQCLMFQLTPTAARDAYRLTGSHQGRRLVLAIDGVPLGARRIDAPIADGIVFVFVEVPDSALPELVGGLKRGAAEMQREMRRKR